MALFDRKPIDFVDQVLSNIDMFDLPYRITRCDRTRCAPNWSWHHAPNQDTGFNLWFIVAGGGTLQTSQACYELHPGDCFLLRLWDLNIGAPNPAKPLVVSWVCFDGLDRRGIVLPPVKYPAVREHRRAHRLIRTPGRWCLLANSSRRFRHPGAGGVAPLRTGS